MSRPPSDTSHGETARAESASFETARAEKLASDTARQRPPETGPAGAPPERRRAEEYPPASAARDAGLGRIAQLGVIIIALGIMLTLIGLFPGITGTPPIGDIGQLQITVIVSGFCLQIFGGWVYVRYTFYPEQSLTLIQQVGGRLALTGLLFSLLSGFADILGFGSHGGHDGFFLGRGQAVGLVCGFLLASIGLLIYTLGGRAGPTRKS